MTIFGSVSCVKKGREQQCEDCFLIRCSTSAAAGFCGSSIHLEDLPVFTSSAAGVGTLPSHTHTHTGPVTLATFQSCVRQTWRNAEMLPGATAAWGGAGPGDSGGRGWSGPGRLRQEWQPRPLGLRGKSTSSDHWARSAVHHHPRLLEHTGFGRNPGLSLTAQWKFQQFWAKIKAMTPSGVKFYSISSDLSFSKQNGCDFTYAAMQLHVY